MAQYTFQLDLCQDASGDTNAIVCVYFDGECVAHDMEVTSSDMNNPDTFEFVVDKENGNYDLSVEFTNDEFVSVEVDRNVNWCATRINGKNIR